MRPITVLPCLSLCLAVLGFSAPVSADEGATIVVTGRGPGDTPAAPAYDVQDIARERLNASASGRIEDALSGIAGFQQFRRSDSRSANPSAQGVTLRALGGNATSRALVLLDGVPMADPFFGYVPLSALAPDRLAGARVTRGGGSGAFGAGAVAGTIELTSAGPDVGGAVSASALASQRGESELSASLAPRLGQGFLVASGRWERGRGFWTTPVSQRGPASVRARYRHGSGSLRMVAPLAPDVELQARIMAYDDARTLRFAGADSTSSGQDMSLRVVGRGRWGFDALAYVQARDFSNVVVSATSFRPTLNQRATPSTGIGGKVELRPALRGGHVLKLGADFRQGRGQMVEDAISAVSGKVTATRRAGGTSSDLGLYAEDDWTLGALVLTGGVRLDRWSIRDGFFREISAAGALTANNRFAGRSGWTSSLRGGAVWQAGEGLRLRAAAYSGLRLPTLNELYRPFTVFPVTTRANANLANERLRGFDLGLDAEPVDGVTLSLTAFDNRLRNAIANVTIGPNLRQRQNVRAIAARGIEAGLGIERGPWRFDGALALTRARVRASGALDGKRPAQTPALAGSATLAWQPAANTRLAATLRHTGRQFEDDLETDALPAATTLDLFGQVPLAGALSLVLRGENVTNTKVVTRNQGGSIDLGAPRTLWAGLCYGI